MMILAASVSAFINNTPVVAVFIPVIMAVARDQGMSPSKFLIPLSYASLLGGCCTLIGTSTNLVVHGVAVAEGHPGFGMFELGKVGLPIAVIGIAYTAIFAKRVLPDRGTVSSILAPEERGAQIYQIMIDRGSPLIGRPVLDFLRQSGGAKLLELRRQAMTIRAELDEQRLQQYDRLTIVVNRENVVRNAGQPDSLKFGEASDLELGIETLSRVKGGLYEGVVTPQSPLIGRTLREFRFRQRHGGLVLAVHRRGHNLKGRFADTPLRVGDTLLLVCPAHAEEQLTEEGELAFNEPETLEDKPKPKASWHRAAVWAAIAAVVIVSTFNWAPISGAAIAACALLVLARITDARSAYRAIDWTIVMLIFGMLALGEAFSKTGLASLIANSAVTFTMSAVPQTVAPYSTPQCLHFHHLDPYGSHVKQCHRHSSGPFGHQNSHGAGREHSAISHWSHPSGFPCLCLSHGLPNPHDGLWARGLPIPGFLQNRSAVEPDRLDHRKPAHPLLLADAPLASLFRHRSSSRARRISFSSIS
ncbi:MAG: SLC13 family permease [Verrucomicrobiales bacterium]